MKNKRKYKEYKRQYEKVFTSEGVKKSFDFEKLSTDYPGGKDEYVAEVKSFMGEVNNTLFSFFLSIFGCKGGSFTMVFKKVATPGHL